VFLDRSFRQPVRHLLGGLQRSVNAYLIELFPVKDPFVRVGVLWHSNFLERCKSVPLVSKVVPNYVCSCFSASFEFRMKNQDFIFPVHAGKDINITVAFTDWLTVCNQINCKCIAGRANDMSPLQVEVRFKMFDNEDRRVWRGDLQQALGRVEPPSAREVWRFHIKPLSWISDDSCVPWLNDA
jgi:hypothetical protein